MIRSSCRVVTVAVAWLALATLSMASPAAHAASIVVSPTIVAPGGSVRVTGDVLASDGTPGCTVPGTVKLISDAFFGLGDFAGVGAVSLPVDASAHFDRSVTLSSSVAEGTYRITGRCGGGNIGVEATLEVTSLAVTGPGPAARPTIAVATGMVACGLALVKLTGRRRPRAA